MSGQASLRLESYLFTKEAMEAARDHLTDDGVFTMYNYYRHAWLVDRYGNTLKEVYGDAPCAGELVPAIGKNGIALDALYASKDRGSLDCPGTAQAKFWSPSSDDVPAPATDNHPFPYLHTNVLPPIYVWTLLLVLIVSLVAVRVTAGPLKQMLPYADLFFMGVAFLLLETKSVVQFALLFGTTWLVNALVFAGVLTSVLIAILISKRVTFKRPQRLYGFLLALARHRVGAAGVVAAVDARRAALRRRGGRRVRTDLPGEPGVHPAVQGHQPLGDRVRCEPPRLRSSAGCSSTRRWWSGTGPC